MALYLPNETPNCLEPKFTMKKNTNGLTAAVLGASPKTDRYSHMAMMRLRDAGCRVLPVNPAYREIEGLMSSGTVRDAADAAGSEGLHTLTLYLAPHHLEPLVDDIVAASPGRVIFNPGTESSKVQNALDKAGIPWIEACTLVLLATGQY
jgi:predicted CoA-binding protein